MEEFPQEIHEALGYYVYRLIDPRNGLTFYIGKGRGNRVFQHMMDSLSLREGEDDVSEKLRTIREIRAEGLSPLHVIHRHRMSEREALLVEAAMIDAHAGLTNVMGGHGSDDCGPATAKQLLMRYQAKEMVMSEQQRLMAINISSSCIERPIEDAVACAWRVSLSRAKRATHILAMIGGVCRDVFVPQCWLPATKENFPQLQEDRSGRYGFRGARACEEDAAMFVGKKLPLKYQRRKGMASPVLYTYK